MPRQPIRGLAMGPWREREQLRKVRRGGRNQLAHGDNHGIRSPRGVSRSPPWRATSKVRLPNSGPIARRNVARRAGTQGGDPVFERHRADGRRQPSPVTRRHRRCQPFQRAVLHRGSPRAAHRLPEGQAEAEGRDAVPPCGMMQEHVALKKARGRSEGSMDTSRHTRPDSGLRAPLERGDGEGRFSIPSGDQGRTVPRTFRDRKKQVKRLPVR